MVIVVPEHHSNLKKSLLVWKGLSCLRSLSFLWIMKQGSDSVTHVTMVASLQS